MIFIIISDIFPNGMPDQFSISCTFRKNADKRNWTLISVNDYNGQPQLVQFGIDVDQIKSTNKNIIFVGLV